MPIPAGRQPSRPVDGRLLDGRLRDLLQAHQSIAGELSLHPMLDRIVRAATGLVDARYGEFSVAEADGVLTQYVIHGIGPDTEACLSIPIEIRGALFGVLCVADPPVGSFSAEDAEMLRAFAAGAGSALESAQLREDAQRSHDWLNASGDITRLLLAGTDDDLLQEVVTRALDTASADYAAIVVPAPAGLLKVAVTAGMGADVFRGQSFATDTTALAAAIVSGRALLMSDLADWTSPDFAAEHHYGPAMIAPLIDARGVRGTLMLIRRTGRNPFEKREADLATTFAAQVALALELSDARADAEWLRSLEDRHRIAQDLHDNVMQRLFAIGVGLQGLVTGALDDGAADRLGRHINDLDDTIDQIRERVFGLRGEAKPAERRARNRFPSTALTDLDRRPVPT